MMQERQELDAVTSACGTPMGLVGAPVIGLSPVIAATPVPAVIGPGVVIGPLVITDRVAVVAGHLVILEWPVPDIDPSDQSGRDRLAVVKVRTDEQLGGGRDIDTLLARSPADQVAVDVEGHDASIPGRGHVVPLAGVPLRDRDGGAAAVIIVGVRGLEAQKADVLRE